MNYSERIIGLVFFSNFKRILLCPACLIWCRLAALPGSQTRIIYKNQSDAISKCAQIFYPINILVVWYVISLHTNEPVNVELVSQIYGILENYFLYSNFSNLKTT